MPCTVGQMLMRDWSRELLLNHPPHAAAKLFSGMENLVSLPSTGSPAFQMKWQAKLIFMFRWCRWLTRQHNSHFSHSQSIVQDVEDFSFPSIRASRGKKSRAKRNRFPPHEGCSRWSMSPPMWPLQGMTHVSKDPETELWQWKWWAINGWESSNFTSLVLVGTD